MSMHQAVSELIVELVRCVPQVKWTIAGGRGPQVENENWARKQAPHYSGDAPRIRPGRFLRRPWALNLSQCRFHALTGLIQKLRIHASVTGYSLHLAARSGVEYSVL